MAEQVYDLRIKPDYNINEIRSYLQEDELLLMEELRRAIPEELLEDEEIRAWVTDSTLCRYLRARNWNLDASLKMLKETLIWRKEVSAVVFWTDLLPVQTPQNCSC